MMPVMLLMKGHPGTGKSTLAHALATSLHWPLIDKDDARDCLCSLEEPDTISNVTPPSDSQSTLPPLSAATGYQETAQSGRATVAPDVLNELSYEVMWRIAERQLAVGLSVIVDCPLAREKLLTQALQVGQRQKAQVAVLECRPEDVDIWKARLEGRAAAAREFRAPGYGEENAASEAQACGPSSAGIHTGTQGRPARWHKPATWADMEKVLERYSGSQIYDMRGTPHLVLDSSLLGPGECLQKALAWLRLLSLELGRGRGSGGAEQIGVFDRFECPGDEMIKGCRC